MQALPGHFYLSSGGNGLCRGMLVLSISPSSAGVYIVEHATSCSLTVQTNFVPPSMSCGSMSRLLLLTLYLPLSNYQCYPLSRHLPGVHGYNFEEFLVPSTSFSFNFCFLNFHPCSSMHLRNTYFLSSLWELQ